MGIIIKEKSGYYNTNAVQNTIRYITRTRKNENKSYQLICWGAYGASTRDAEKAITGFVSVKKAYQKKYGAHGGNNVAHFYYLPDSETADLLRGRPEAIWNIGDLNAREFYTRGYQVVWAAHWGNDQHLHYHMICNAYPYRNGIGKFRSTLDLKYDLTEIFNKNAKYITNVYCEKA